MAQMPISAVLTPRARPSGLLQVALPLPRGWERGVDVLVGPLTQPDRTGPCPVGEGETPKGPGEIERFVPVMVRQGLQCTMLGNPDIERYAQQAIDATVGFALEAEMLDGAATSNPSLTGSDDPQGTVPTVAAGLAVLEGLAYQALYGRQAVLHIPVGLSAYLEDLTTVDGNGIRKTPAGSLVAIYGAGETMYVTGDVWASVGTAEVVEYHNRAINQVEAWATAPALAVFDPSFVASVIVDLNISPTGW